MQDRRKDLSSPYSRPPNPTPTSAIMQQGQGQGPHYINVLRQPLANVTQNHHAGNPDPSCVCSAKDSLVLTNDGIMPDPCIPPASTDLLCSSDYVQRLDPSSLPVAGRPSVRNGEAFAFGSVKAPRDQQCDVIPAGYPQSVQCPTAQSFNSFPCKSMMAVADDAECPCSNRGGFQAQQQQQRNISSPQLVVQGQGLVQGHGLLQGQGRGLRNPNGAAYYAHHYNQPQIWQPGHQGPPSHRGPHTPLATLSAPAGPPCAGLYNPVPYVCRPVYDRKYLMDCPEQDGPPADTYTFL